LPSELASASDKLLESSTILSSMAWSSVLRNLLKDTNPKLQKEWLRYMLFEEKNLLIIR